MPNYVRWRESGASYFFTVVTYRRRHLFREPMARRLLRRAMVEVRKGFSFDMFACVLLPDHLHCLWTLPDGDDDFPVRWANIKRTFTQSYLRDGGQALPVSKNRAAITNGVFGSRAIGNTVFGTSRTGTNIAITSTSIR